MTTNNRSNDMSTPQTINIDGTDYVPADSIPTRDTDGDALAHLVDKSVFIRTVTMHYTGRVIDLTADTITLADAAWIADSGRFSTALSTGTLFEVEPFPGPVSIGRGALVDITVWDHPLPREAR